MGRDDRRSRGRLKPRVPRACSKLVAFGAALAGALGLSLAAAQSAKQRDAQLQTVRKEIKALEARVAGQVAQRDDVARALRAAELDAAAGARKLTELRARMAAQKGQQRTLGEQTQRAHARLAAERTALGREVRLRYMNGREELFKLLLSQQDPAALGRMLVYYDYLNRARTERVALVAAEVGKLREIGAETDRVASELAALEAAQAAEAASLAAARDERKTAVAQLEAGIASATGAMTKLRADEKRLADLVVELTELMAEFPVDSEQPFAKLKGKLAWPVQGRLVGDYGKPRDGGPLRWNGVLLEASQGTQVRAVYRGRIAFADWLPGLGLLIIVDHGDGYLSLYGHNEALLKEPGDWVDPGEAIAQVGDTGGRPRPGLYFEIRRNGKPVNPHPWLAGTTPRR
jgi:septal ring factor EnvC (AmiA/AmiB activator)